MLALAWQVDFEPFPDTLRQISVIIGFRACLTHFPPLLSQTFG